MAERLQASEEKTLGRVLVLQDILSEQRFEGSACPLLQSQIDAALVITKKLATELEQLGHSVTSRIGR